MEAAITSSLERSSRSDVATSRTLAALFDRIHCLRCNASLADLWLKLGEWRVLEETTSAMNRECRLRGSHSRTVTDRSWPAAATRLSTVNEPFAAHLGKTPKSIPRSHRQAHQLSPDEWKADAIRVCRS
jgi:hypothetical protein